MCPQNKQRLSPCTTITVWFLQPKQRVFTARYGLSSYITQTSFVFKELIFRNRRIYKIASDWTTQSILEIQNFGLIFHLGGDKDLMNFVVIVASGWKYVMIYPHFESLKYDKRQFTNFFCVFLMFCWPCIVIYPYNKNQQMQYLL
jgi:hypothetical protein